MTISIQPIDPANRGFFTAEVSGIDLTRRLSDAEVAAIHAGMDRYGVLVFHDQRLDDDAQLA
ncbi:MAG: TauD/TfdA family dioxygenase, partial [Reyranella sp.]|nr:TauD/TfdA family dioxygenase [Reyranella sp.]